MGYKEMYELLELAVKKLQDVDIKQLETVEVNQTKYDDGSIGYSINLTFPAKED